MLAADVLAWRSTVTTTRSGGNFQSLAHRVDNAAVGLVRHQPIDIRVAQAVRRQRLLDHGRELHHGLTEHLLPLHDQMTGPVGAADGAIHIKYVAQAAICVQVTCR